MISTYLYKIKTKLLGKQAPRVAVVRLEGVIAAQARMGRGISLESVEDDLEKAFNLPGLEAVALIINSPGGAVVQSARIAERIRFLAKKKSVPVLAFGDDVMASGGYMLALAADEIFVHEASMVGSIGVIASGFGFVELIKRFGVERRVHAAGENKAMLDPFLEEDPEHSAHFDSMLDEVHEQFKAYVRDRRGKRLKGLRGKIFSGEIYTGREAVKLGLVDDVRELQELLMERFGEAVELKYITKRKTGLLAMLPFGGGEASARFAAREAGLPALAAHMEEMSVWQRFGL